MVLAQVVLATLFCGSVYGAERAGPEEPDSVSSMNSDQTEATGSTSTWNTNAVDAATTVDHDADLGVDDAVGTGAQIQQDAANVDREIEQLESHLEFTRSKSVWDFWWENGNAYIEHRDDYHIVSRQRGKVDLQKPQFRAKIGAKGSFDAAVYDPSNLDAFDFEDGIDLRRMKIYAKGQFLLAVPVAYKVQFGYGGAGFQLSDFFVRIANGSKWGHIQLGNFRAPFSVARVHSSFDYPMMEFPAPVEAFAPGYKTGYQADWSMKRTGSWSWQGSSPTRAPMISVTPRTVWPASMVGSSGGPG